MCQYIKKFKTIYVDIVPMLCTRVTGKRYFNTWDKFRRIVFCQCNTITPLMLVIRKIKKDPHFNLRFII